MRYRRHDRDVLLPSSGISTPSIGWYAAVSLVLHIALFFILTYLPELMPQREFKPSVIMVNMVTLAPAGSAGKPGPPGKEQPAPQAAKPPAEKPGVQELKAEKPKPPEPKPEPPMPKPEKIPVSEPKPEPAKQTDVISLSNEKPKEKTSLKKETFKSSQVIKSAINRLEKQVESDKADPLASALDRIRSQVEKTETSGAKTPAKGQGSGQAGSGGEGGSGGIGPVGVTAIDFYRSLIPNHIEANWVFNENFAGGRTDLVAVVVVKIMQNGNIADVWFEKKSGNGYFDDSVYKAVKRSSPMPPLPNEYTKPFYELGLVFTPKGLKRS